MTLVELELVLPPFFAEACGYRGAARHVALRWAPELFELRWSDDGRSFVGESNAFLALCSHPATAAALEPFHRANSAEGLRPWLLLDRDRRRVSFGTAAEVWRVLDGQGAPSVGRGQLARPPHRQRWLKGEVSAWLDRMRGRRGRARRRLRR